MTTILVTGGTGTLGRLLVPRLRAADHAVRVLSRSAHQPDDGVEFVKGDLATGEGVEAAVAGARRSSTSRGRARATARRRRTS
jgi:nucleoside-diphosphate-sugar epimerase